MIITLPDFRSLKSSGVSGRLMGIDVGDKTLGLCLSDTTWMIASPLETLRRQTINKDLEKLFSIIDQYQVVGLVIGLPLNMNGTYGPQAQKTRTFVEELLKYRDVPVIFWDERLSTQAVTRTLIEADVSRKKRGKLVDKMAASYILQGVLDALR